MRETAEFRVAEKYAAILFADGEGKRLSDFIRKIEIETNDPRFSEVGRLQRELLIKEDSSFFHGWTLRRRYTKGEMTAAAAFQFIISTSIEHAGEQCGTKYDETTGCPQCGTGAIQVSDLSLDLRKAPRNKDVACTIADEVIVSQRMAEGMLDAGLTGFELRPVRDKAQRGEDPFDLRQVPTGQEILRKAAAAGAPHPTGRFIVWLNRAENRGQLDQARAECQTSRGPCRDMPVWHQLVVNSASARVVDPTRAGIDPFDNDRGGQYRCPAGHLIGLNLLSEVSVDATSRGEADFVYSQQFVGVRRGFLRPRRVIVVSPKVRRLVETEGFRGVNFEVVHLT